DVLPGVTTRESENAWLTMFPFAVRPAYEMSCILALDEHRTKEIYICSVCENERLAWVENHPHDRWVQSLHDSEEKPNKAPEPTTMAVTPPAAQESRQP